MLNLQRFDIIINTPSDILILDEKELVNKSILINGELLSPRNCHTKCSTALNVFIMQHRVRKLNVLIFNLKSAKLDKRTLFLLTRPPIRESDNKEAK